MKNNIILIRPPQRLFGRKTKPFFYHQPLNLCYLAAVLEKEEFKVIIYDFEIEVFNVLELVGKIKKTNPLLIGFTCYTNTITEAGRIASFIKANIPRTIIVVGGRHSTALPKRTLEEFEGFDIVVMGEGEKIFSDLAKSIRSGKDYSSLENIAYREGDKIIRNKFASLNINLDKIPFPARHLLNWELCNNIKLPRSLPLKGSGLASLLTSRGCPGKCIFCAGSLGYNNQVRLRGPDSVLAETEECINRYGASHFDILDDSFTLDPSRLWLILKGFRKLGVKSWSCQTRVDMVTKDILFDMAAAGCNDIFFGIESGSPRILKLINKGISLKQAINAVKWAKEAGIKLIKLSFMIGCYPDETKEDIKMTKKLLKRLNPDVGYVGILVPYPGTEIYEIMKKKRLILFEDWEKFVMYGTLPTWRTTFFSPQELSDIQSYILIKYHLSLQYILKKILGSRNYKDIKQGCRAGITGLRFLWSAVRKK